MLSEAESLGVRGSDSPCYLGGWGKKVTLYHKDRIQQLKKKKKKSSAKKLLIKVSSPALKIIKTHQQHGGGE